MTDALQQKNKPKKLTVSLADMLPMFNRKIHGVPRKQTLIINYRKIRTY